MSGRTDLAQLVHQWRARAADLGAYDERSAEGVFEECAAELEAVIARMNDDAEGDAFERDLHSD